MPLAPATGHKAGVRLSFKNSYNTEPGFDGAVLELSINGGAFTDIVTAGGTFAGGGYSAVIGPTDSTLNGRAAWTGNSGGFIMTVVNLPAAAFGQNVQFRWRYACDTGVSPGGVRIDDIAINTVTYICCEGACVLACPTDIVVANDVDFCGAIVSYPPETAARSRAVLLRARSSRWRQRLSLLPAHGSTAAVTRVRST